MGTWPDRPDGPGGPDTPDGPDGPDRPDGPHAGDCREWQMVKRDPQPHIDCPKVNTEYHWPY